MRKMTTVKIDKKTRNQTKGVNILIKVVILESSAGYAVNMYQGVWYLRVAKKSENYCLESFQSQYKEKNILHGRTTIETQSFHAPKGSDCKLVTGVTIVIPPGDGLPGGRDVVDLHKGGDDLILPSDGRQ